MSWPGCSSGMTDKPTNFIYGGNSDEEAESILVAEFRLRGKEAREDVNSGQRDNGFRAKPFGMFWDPIAQLWRDPDAKRE